jgi:uncharacterized protein with PIN domain
MTVKIDVARYIGDLRKKSSIPDEDLRIAVSALELSVFDADIRRCAECNRELARRSRAA